MGRRGVPTRLALPADDGAEAWPSHPFDPLMFDDPYLETCCRSALHRLVLSGADGRPADGKDSSCLTRLCGLGLAVAGSDGRFRVLAAGRSRHAAEIAGSPGRR